MLYAEVLKKCDMSESKLAPKKVKGIIVSRNDKKNQIDAPGALRNINGNATPEYILVCTDKPSVSIALFI